MYDIDKASSLLSTLISSRLPRGAKSEELRQENFISTEIAQVIKGRGIGSWEEYQEIERVGRGQKLHEGPRKVIWEIFMGYQQKLADINVIDEADLFVLSTKKIREESEFEPFPQVIVDEAQDMSPKALELAST